MITLARGVTIGMNVSLSCHLNPDGKTHVQKPISIGARTLIGTDSRIGPGSTIGQDCVIGGNSSLTIDVVLGDGVRVGAHTLIRPGIRVGDGARIASNSVVSRDVGPGETWPKPHADSGELGRHESLQSHGKSA